jgi:Anti-sigma-K factor rskA
VSTRPRSHEELAELLGAYALDALDDTEGEREAVRLHVLECARCRAEVAEHREVAALLAHAGEPAPPAVWDRIAASIEGEAPPATPPVLRSVAAVPPGPAAPDRSRRWWTRPVAGLAAAAVVLIAALGWLAVDANQRLDDLEGDRGVAAAMADALVDPDSTVVDLEGAVDVRAVVADGHGFLAADELPPAPDGRTYQLWGGGADGMVSLGVLGQAPSEPVAFEAGNVDALALTVEERPQPAPVGPQVAIGEVRA